MMNSSIFKKVGLLASLTSTSLVLGQDAPATSQPTTGTNSMPVMGYNAPCRIEVQDSFDLFFTGSFIYWQPIQENMSLGVVSDNSGTSDLVNGRQQDLHCAFKPGFQVGLGMNFDYDSWETYAQYTWFRATEHTSAHVDIDNANLAIFPSWQIPDFLNPTYKSGSETWKLHMDIIDWDLARSFYVGKKTCLRPFFGLRSAFIKQSINASYTNYTEAALSTFSSTSVSHSTNSWSLGPRFGLLTKWDLGQGIRFFAEEELDILYTQYKLNAFQGSAASTPNVYNVNQPDLSALRAHAQLDLGIGWGTYLANDGFHIDLSADYCFQAFFDQNMFRSFYDANAIGKSQLPNGNLYIQGLRISARFDF